MKKTLSFAAVHFTVALTLAYLLTGDVLFASLIALLEPLVNTVAFYGHEQLWQAMERRRSTIRTPKRKTVSFAVVHFSVAFGIAYLLTGNVLVGGVMALIEPSINTGAYYLHEQFWQRKIQRQALWS